jgi:hypothetical protein
MRGGFFKKSGGLSGLESGWKMAGKRLAKWLAVFS